MTVKKIKIFDKILDKLQPICCFEELGINVYDPDYLSKEASLTIFDFQTTAGYLYDSIKQKSEQISELSNADLNDNNLALRKEYAREIIDINDKLDAERANYVEIVCKLKKGELQSKINAYLEENEELENYPVQQLIKDVYEKVNETLSEFRKSQTEIIELDSTEKKE